MYAFYILFAIAFAGTYYVLPHSIRKLKENNYVVKDMYKRNQPLIPTNAGMILLFTSFISISLLPLIGRVLSFFTDAVLISSDLSQINLALLLVVTVYALYGLVDDLVDIGRKLKILLPISFGFPLISLVNPETIWLPILGNFNLMSVFYSDILWNDLFRIFVIPIYVMVVSNLVNMHSGYNGLQSGLSLILLSALVAQSWFKGNLDNILPVASFLGSIFSFWFFNKYPSKIFEGNVGSLLFGSLIGSVIVIQQFWWFGFFILFPHTFNFILWTIWLYLMRTNSKIYLLDTGQHQKFGSVSKEGIIRVPNMLTLKWIPNYFFKMDEKSSTNTQYFITLAFCIIGVLIF